MTALGWREAGIRAERRTELRNQGRGRDVAEPGERGRHYHIMLICNYKLSYPRVNPAPLPPPQIYISRPHAVSSRTIARDRYPSGPRAPSPRARTRVQPARVGGRRSSQPRVGHRSLSPRFLRSKVKNVRLSRVTTRRSVR